MLRSHFSAIFSALLLIFAALALISRFWAAEDAYITFRAVENLYNGYGLVYNPGERVEVFTHPLWMMCLVVLRGIGIPLHAGSILLGFGLTLLALGYLIFRDDNKSRLILPLAPLALIAHSGFRDFTVSGLEFSMVFFLLVLIYQELEERRISERPLFLATLLALLYLTRPELALLAVYYTLFLLYEFFSEWRSSLGAFQMMRWLKIMVRWAAPFLLLAGSYHLFRFFYYNDIFPNTYYAKAGGSGYYLQGLKYLSHTVIYSPSFWIIFAMLLTLPWVRSGRGLLTDERRSYFYRDLGAALLLIFYVVRVGGDFMSFRFLLPALTILALVAQRFLTNGEFYKLLPQRWRDSNWPATALLLLFIGFSLIPTPYSSGYIADERQVFTAEMKSDPLSLLSGQDHPWGERGDEFRRLAECLQLDEFWITNSQADAKCMRGVGLGYFGMGAGPQVKILDEQGLSDKGVARQPVLLRFRPGHEHKVSLGDVIDKGVLFCSTGEASYDRVMATPAGIIINFDADLLATLPNIRERLQELSQLKRQGSAIIPRLEERYGETVEELLRRSAGWERDALFKSKQQCWRKFPGDKSGYFY